VNIGTTQLKLLRNTALIGTSFLVHLWALTASKIFADAISFEDLYLYDYWAFMSNNGAGWYGLVTDWVYPALAFLPIWIAGLVAALDYWIVWLALVFILNTDAALTLVKKTESNKPFAGTFASWAFLAALFAIGPVAVSRIDSVSAALAIFGLVAINRNQIATASAFFTIAGWIKIWPVGLFVSLLATVEQKAKALYVALSITLSIVIVGLVTGGTTVFGFITQQQDRGIQIESVMATLWMWLAKFGLAGIFFDEQVLTNQVSGVLVEEVASASNWLMLLALTITFLLALRAIRVGRNRKEVFALASLTGVLDLIVFNKVGSPQFMTWLAVALVAIIFFEVRSIKTPLVIGGTILLLTQLIYPVFYTELLGLETLPLWLLTIRNLLLVWLLIWANLRLSRAK
jgi:hypothetical protein